jgi:putative DNA methylase
VKKNKDEWQVVESSIPGFSPKVPFNFEPEKGTVSRAIAVCPVCGGMVDDKQVRRLFKDGKAGQRMVAVVLHNPRTQGKTYRLATEKDLEIFKSAEKYLEEKRKKLWEEWGIDPVPDEEIDPNSLKPRTMWLYGMSRWGDLFNSRQKLALITFTEKVRLAYKKMIEEGYDKEYAKAVVSYLGLGVSRVVEYMSNLCIHDNTQERTVHVFGRQALPMVWDYSELNPLSEAVGSWESMFFRRILLSLSHLTQIPPVEVEEGENG